LAPAATVLLTMASVASASASRPASKLSLPYRSASRCKVSSSSIGKRLGDQAATAEEPRKISGTLVPKATAASRRLAPAIRSKARLSQPVCAACGRA